ncbi:MAG: hypothetical protein LUE97_05360 [Oscillospiraceae bacterium]|nr:hypothetical protein [Oscillospiraceae bacterium]
MKFGTFLLRVDGVREASLEDFKQVCEKGVSTFCPDGQKYLYVVETEMIEDRFFWLACDYDDAASFRDYVVNQSTGKKEPNPRNKSQVEPRKQFFACYDTEKHFLYINDLNRRNTLTSYMSDSIRKKFVINNVYASVDEFCERIKSIRGFKYTQVDNLFSRGGDIFQQVSNIWGLDAPEKIQLKISYGDVPVHQGRALLDWFHRDKDQFEDIIVIGCDDAGVEHTFDFSSIIKRIEIYPTKDENEHYEPADVRTLLLAELRK